MSQFNNAALLSLLWFILNAYSSHYTSSICALERMLPVALSDTSAVCELLSKMIKLETNHLINYNL